MSVKGDYAKLASWAKRLEAVASPQYMSANTREMSKATLALIEKSFATESSPTRQKWRPKKIPNGEQILVEKNHMRTRFSAVVGFGRFEIRNPQPYTNTHQYGFPDKNIPVRQMWPHPGKLPVVYLREYQAITIRRFFKIIKGG